MEKQQEVVRILRMASVEDRLGKKKSSIWADVNNQLLTKPVEVGAGCKGWPENEITAVIHARIRGQSEDDIKRLVGELHARRKTIGDNATEAAK